MLSFTLKGLKLKNPLMLVEYIMGTAGDIRICRACYEAKLPVCKDRHVFSGDVLKKTEFGVYRRNECGERVRL